MQTEGEGGGDAHLRKEAAFLHRWKARTQAPPDKGRTGINLVCSLGTAWGTGRRGGAGLRVCGAWRAVRAVQVLWDKAALGGYMLYVQKSCTHWGTHAHEIHSP